MLAILEFSCNFADILQRNMKLNILFFLLALLSSMQARAYDAEIDDIYYEFSNYEATVTYGNSFNSYSGNVVIPETVTYNDNTYRITSIGNRAFQYCSSLASVTIPEGVKSIGFWAFKNCTSLTSITIPEGITSIGESAFSGCSRMTSITIPNSLTCISDYTFEGCVGLTSVTIPGSVTRIGNNAFYDCSSLTSIIIPESVTHIGQCAFYGCKGLTSVTIPKSVIWTGGALFIECSNLISVTIESNAMMSDINHGIKSVFGGQVKECIIGDAVTTIGQAAFAHCYDLSIVSIPNSVKFINSYAFDHCTGLTSINLGNSVKHINFRAFSFCTSLASVTIPNSIKIIDGFAFEGCIGLAEVYCLAENVPIADNSSFSYLPMTSTTLYVPMNSLESYMASSPWKEFEKIIGLTEDEIDSIKEIESFTPSVSKGEGDWYLLDGKKVGMPQKGLNIIHDSKGTNKKVLVK